MSMADDYLSLTFVQLQTVFVLFIVKTMPVDMDPSSLASSKFVLHEISTVYITGIGNGLAFSCNSYPRLEPVSCGSSRLRDTFQSLFLR